MADVLGEMSHCLWYFDRKSFREEQMMDVYLCILRNRSIFLDCAVSIRKTEVVTRSSQPKNKKELFVNSFRFQTERCNFSYVSSFNSTFVRPFKPVSEHFSFPFHVDVSTLFYYVSTQFVKGIFTLFTYVNF